MANDDEPNWRHERSEAELREALDRQLRNFRRSCEAYDAGNKEEAERLAAIIYTLVNDGQRRLVSLLSRLGLRSSLRFVDSTNDPRLQIPREAIMVANVPLCAWHVSKDGVEYDPRFKTDGDVALPLLTKMKFADWWEQKVYRTREGLSLSRKNLVSTMRSQDGGAHVDAAIREEAYHRLAVDADPLVRARPEGGIMFSFMFDGSMKAAPGAPIPEAHWASMRQIAWEVDETLKASGL